MKQVLVLLSLSLFIGCGPKRPSLDGDYVPVKQEFGGIPMPDSSLAKQKLSISDSNYTFVAESVDKGILRFADGKMDIFGKDGVNAGKHFSAIYKFENDLLNICYNLSGDAYPNTYDTKGHQMWFSCVFKKEIKQ